MPGRIVPEPPQPDRDPEHLAEERELARSAKLAGLGHRIVGAMAGWNMTRAAPAT